LYAQLTVPIGTVIYMSQITKEIPVDTDPLRQQPLVESVPLSRVVPDRYQARLALPPEIKTPFFTGEIDCYEAARSLLIAAEGDSGLFRLVGELQLLGQSILNESQIDPATGSWLETGNGPVFVLETGERRFWSLALQAVSLQLREEPELKVISQPGNSRQRQVVENFLREDFCAVEMGKAVATMILESMDIYPADGEDEMVYYRKALRYDRLPRHTWPEIERLTGYSRPVLYRHLHLLELDDDLLYLAILYRLPEGALRDIITAPTGERRGMVLALIEKHLSTSDSESRAHAEREASNKGGSQPDPLAYQKSMRKFILSLKPFADGDYDRAAEEISRILTPENLDIVASILSSLANKLRQRRGQRG
jgi:hypothetical protein